MDGVGCGEEDGFNLFGGEGWEVRHEFVDRSAADDAEERDFTGTRAPWKQGVSAWISGSS